MAKSSIPFIAQLNSEIVELKKKYANSANKDIDSIYDSLLVVNRSLFRLDSMLLVMSDYQLWRSVWHLKEILAAVTVNRHCTSDLSSKILPVIDKLAHDIVEAASRIKTKIKIRQELSKVHVRGQVYFDHFTWSFLFKLHTRHPDTLTWLLIDFQNWLHSSNQIGAARMSPVKVKTSPNSKGSPGKNRLHSSCVWHLCGQQGSGKTIACAALVDSLRSDGFLLASIFCDASDRSPTLVMNIVKSIALQSAECLPQYAHIFHAAFSRLIGDETNPVDVLNILVVDTLSQIDLTISADTNSTRTNPGDDTLGPRRLFSCSDFKVIVLDCIDATPLGSLERLQILNIFQYFCDVLVLPHWVKVVIASRAEDDIMGVVEVSTPPARVEMLDGPVDAVTTGRPIGHISRNSVGSVGSDIKDNHSAKRIHMNLFGNEKFMGDFELVTKLQLREFMSSALSGESLQWLHVPVEGTGIEELVTALKQNEANHLESQRHTVDVSDDIADPWISEMTQLIVKKSKWNYSYNSLLFEVCLPKITASLSTDEQDDLKNEVSQVISRLPSGCDELLCWVFNSVSDANKPMSDAYGKAMLFLIVQVSITPMQVSCAEQLFTYLINDQPLITLPKPITSQNDFFWFMLKAFQELVEVKQLHGKEYLMSKYGSMIRSWASGVIICDGHLTLQSEAKDSTHRSVLSMTMSALWAFTKTTLCSHYDIVSEHTTSAPAVKDLPGVLSPPQCQSREALLSLQCALHHTLPTLLEASYFQSSEHDVMEIVSIAVSLCVHLPCLIDILSSPNSSGGIDGLIYLLHQVLVCLNAIQSQESVSHSGSIVILYDACGVDTDKSHELSISSCIQSIEAIIEVLRLSYVGVWNRSNAVLSCPQQLIGRLPSSLCMQYELLQRLVQHCELMLSDNCEMVTIIDKWDILTTEDKVAPSLSVPDSHGSADALTDSCDATYPYDTAPDPSTAFFDSTARVPITRHRSSSLTEQWTSPSSCLKNWRPLQGTMRSAGEMKMSTMSLYHPEVRVS